MLHLALVSLLALARRDPSTAASTWAGKSQLNSTQLKWQSSLTSSILKLQLRDTQLILISNAFRSTDCSVLLAELALLLDALMICHERGKQRRTWPEVWDLIAAHWVVKLLVDFCDKRIIAILGGTAVDDYCSLHSGLDQRPRELQLCLRALRDENVDSCTQTPYP